MAKKSFKSKLGGKQYTTKYVTRKQLKDAGYGNEDGVCDPPDAAGREIWIYNKCTGLHRLTVLVHEAKHGQQWDKSEEWVTEASEEYALYLWNAGLRFLDESSD